MDADHDPRTDDIFIIGGGINGAGIARDAAGRGLSVVLAEQGDLASGTSSASSKLIHGGLRYLEMLDFGLVCEALAERTILLRTAPHIVRPLPFILPVGSDTRHRWILRLGLWLYEALARDNPLPRSRRIHPSESLSDILKPEIRPGFRYWDCWGDDARLVILNARHAADLGAVIRPRASVVRAEPEADHWRVVTRNAHGRETIWRARALVNATGPWVKDVHDMLRLPGAARPVRKVKGSHIVVPRLYEGDTAYILQNADKRVIFLIPLARDFTMIGTTEVAVTGDPGEAAASDAEVDYLLAAANRYLARPLTRADVRWQFAGVRPLLAEEDGTLRTTTREYSLDLVEAAGPPLLTVYGGKLTTYRRLAEKAMAALAPFFPEMGGDWTANTALPGGDPGVDGMAGLNAALRESAPWLAAETIDRLTAAYGSRARTILASAGGEADTGRHFGGGLYECEVDYLCREEWAVTADDILWRRTKLGLILSDAEQATLSEWLSARSSAEADGNRTRRHVKSPI